MLVVIVELTARPGQRTALEHVLRSLASAAAQEPGVVQYVVHAVQGREEGFLLYEAYRSRGAFEAHLAHPPVVALLARFDDLLVAPPKVTFCERLPET